MKHKTRLVAGILLSATLLTACSTTPKTSQTEQSNSSKKADKKIVKTTFTAQTGSFSIQASNSFQPSTTSTINKILYGNVNRISLYNNVSNLEAVRYDKASIAVPIDEFAAKIITQSSTNGALGNLVFSPKTLADKNGYEASVTFTDNKIDYEWKSFVYEENNYYKLLVFQTVADSSDALEEEISATITSWTDIPVTKTYDLTQTVTLPNVGLTTTIPSDWKSSPRSDGSTEQIDYYSKAEDYYLSFFGQTIEEGYTIDLPAFVASNAADMSPNATTREVTIGNYSGYVIEATDISEEIWSNAMIQYIFQIDNRVIGVYFSVPNGEVEDFRPTMETIIASLK